MHLSRDPSPIRTGSALKEMRTHDSRQKGVVPILKDEVIVEKDIVRVLNSAGNITWIEIGRGILGQKVLGVSKYTSFRQGSQAGCLGETCMLFVATNTPTPMRERG